MSALKGIKESVWPSGKKKLGSPIYVEEDGPILGVVDDVFIDRGSGKPLAYKILASGQYIELPAEAVSETPGGYVYRSPWFGEADDLIRKLEGHELIMPELFFTSPATAGTDKKMLESAMQKSPALRQMVDAARKLHTELQPRIDAMEKERSRLVNQVADLTEAMATGGMDKESYRQGFVALKRRLQVLEATIRRGEALRSRLEAIPFVRVTLNGSATTSGGKGLSEGTHVGVPAGQRGDEWKRIKKVRILKSEKALAEKEARLVELETKLSESGLPLDKTIDAIAQDFQSLVRAQQIGQEALRVAIERRLSSVKPQQPASPPETQPVHPGPTRPALGGKTCPLCGEPLKGDERSCPACHADLASLKPAGPSAGPPGKVDMFMKGGGATKTGVVLLAIGGVLLLLRLLVH